jgi:sugar phosphate isomerase/epimerase
VGLRIGVAHYAKVKEAFRHMLISVGTASFYFRPFHQVLEVIAESGFQCVELDLYWKGGEWEIAQHLKGFTVEETIRSIHALGLRVSSIHDAGGLIQGKGSIAGFIDPSLDRYLDQLGYAPDSIVFHVPHIKGHEDTEWWRTFSGEIAGALEKYKARCTFVTLENLAQPEGYYLPLLEPHDLEAFATEHALGITLDTTHFAQMGVDITEAARILRDRIRSIHLSDFVDGKPHVFIGDGDLDFADFFGVIDFSTLSAITLECLWTVGDKSTQEMTKDELVSRMAQAKDDLERLLATAGAEGS